MPRAEYDAFVATQIEKANATPAPSGPTEGPVLEIAAKDVKFTMDLIMNPDVRAAHLRNYFAELDGTVGPVGGLKQKTLGARAADADVFLVPAGENAQVARQYAGTLRVIPVESYQQALRALRTLPQK